MLTRRHSWPAGHFGWLIPVTLEHGIRCGDLAFVGGQVDKDPAGRVLHPYDMKTQTRVVMGHIRTILADLGVGLDDVVKLVAFYVTDGTVDEGPLLADIAAHLSTAPGLVITTVPVPYLVYPGMLVEIEAVAMLGESGTRLARTRSSPPGLWRPGEPFSPGLRCGQMIYVGGQEARDATGRVRYPGDIVKQSEVVMENLRVVLAEFGATLDDAVKLNVYYVGKGTRADWQRGAEVRAGYFTEPGPVATAIPVPWLPDGLTMKAEVLAMLGEDGARLPRTHVWPEGHWDWVIHLPYKHGLRCGPLIFVGGQVSKDTRGEVVEPGRLVSQTHTVMGHVKTVLAGFGVSMDRVVKVNAFFKSGGTAEEQNANLSVRSACFTDPGPTSTGISFPFLALEGMMIEVEVIAMAT